MIQRNTIQLKYIRNNEKDIDNLTKPLVIVMFLHFVDILGIVENEALVERESQHH